MFRIINPYTYNSDTIYTINLENAKLKIIDIYLKNVNECFFVLDTQQSNFDYDKLLLLQKINQLVIDKKYSEACELILQNYKQLQIIDMLGVNEPKPLDQKEIENAIKIHIFDNSNKKTNRKTNKISSSINRSSYN